VGWTDLRCTFEIDYQEFKTQGKKFRPGKRPIGKVGGSGNIDKRRLTCSSKKNVGGTKFTQNELCGERQKLRHKRQCLVKKEKKMKVEDTPRGDSLGIGGGGGPVGDS